MEASNLLTGMILQVLSYENLGGPTPPNATPPPENAGLIAGLIKRQAGSSIIP